MVSKRMRIYPFLLAAALTPILTFAAVSDFKSLVTLFIEIIGKFVILIFALTFLVIVWGVIKAWIIGGDNVENVASGKKIVMTGILVLVIMSAVWGIVRLLKSSIFG